MENASKALTMAGAVLIALVVISVVVFFFNNIRNLQKTNLTSEEVAQATEFNKQFDVYARNVYGSELLSLANKIADYNKREANNKGYTKITLYVNLEDDVDDKYFIIGEYVIPNDSDLNVLQSKIDSINDELKKYSNRDTNSKYLYINPNNNNISRTIAQLSKMRTDEWVTLLGCDIATKEKIQNEITAYNSLKNLESEIKQKIFKFDKFEYDDNTGRITKMSYELKK